MSKKSFWSKRKKHPHSDLPWEMREKKYETKNYVVTANETRKADSKDGDSFWITSRRDYYLKDKKSS